jgi:hypothetical protein
VDYRQFGYITKLRGKKKPWYGQQQQMCGKSANFPKKKKEKKKDLLWTNEEGQQTNS